ncbi:MAG: nucleotide exchange factor GrpE, partial [Gammaproteobacteria bacterium]|nr:nucleotide exchange factor GrpE [Gammaproteobacteria bacterium]
MNAERPEEVVDEAAEAAQTDAQDDAGQAGVGPEADAAVTDVEAAMADLQAKADENWERYLRAS